MRWELVIKAAGNWVDGHLNYSQIQSASPWNIPNLGNVSAPHGAFLPDDPHRELCRQIHQRTGIWRRAVAALQHVSTTNKRSLPDRGLPRCSAGLLLSRAAASVPLVPGGGLLQGTAAPARPWGSALGGWSFGFRPPKEYQIQSCGISGAAFAHPGQCRGLGAGGLSTRVILLKLFCSLSLHDPCWG